MTDKKKAVIKKNRSTNNLKKIKAKPKIAASNLWARSAKTFTPLSFVLGFIGDFLEPLLDSTLYIFWGVLAMFLASGFFWINISGKKIKTLLEDGKLTKKEYTNRKNDCWSLSLCTFSGIATLRGLIYLYHLGK
jgi:hypothetical protein